MEVPQKRARVRRSVRAMYFVVLKPPFGVGEAPFQQKLTKKKDDCQLVIDAKDGTYFWLLRSGRQADELLKKETIMRNLKPRQGQLLELQYLVP